MRNEKSNNIRDFILRGAADHPRRIGIMAAERFGISRQAVSRHIHILIRRGLLRAVGNTRSREYRRVGMHPEQFESLRKKSPAEKLMLAQQLWQAAFELKSAWLGRQHPDWSDERVFEKTREAFLRART